MQTVNAKEQACDDHDDRKSDLCGSHVFFPPLHFSFIAEQRPRQIAYMNYILFRAVFQEFSALKAQLS